ncbi:MAG: hypothetical protein OI74_15870 [Gammaproteobacteria bacterium (ex Lamellibrachia satsuma)]|nr:MAG: hypothetical protein HPY30_07635 [Gammaproteobacteria bacterium (ex Lamellibrachia satsuma)]RRS30918.1 MAG: hypothetical protein OI74_15870 [Gammaproteobacteria bacterium (ex Lamellibrachia satsuma)]RRS37156.1 MAG: hypothetical protein NV67_02660 [Gammaproteobacteria bacterium (ex Lamellibrachia satsuma)]
MNSKRRMPMALICFGILTQSAVAEEALSMEMLEYLAAWGEQEGGELVDPVELLESSPEMELFMPEGAQPPEGERR